MKGFAFPKFCQRNRQGDFAFGIERNREGVNRDGFSIVGTCWRV